MFVNGTRTIDSEFQTYLKGIVYTENRINYSTKFTFNSRTAECYKRLITELENLKLFLEKNSGSVKIVSDYGSCKKIYGSVGKIKKVYKIENLSKIIDLIEDCKIKKIPIKPTYWAIDKNYYEIENLFKEIKIKFDFPGFKKNKDKDISCTYSIWDLSLIDRDLPVSYIEHKPRATNKKSLLDKFGREMEVGSLVIYSESISKTVSYPRIGNITDISKNNTIYCKNIKMTDTDRQYETRIRNNQSIFLFSDDIKDLVSLAKLSY